ncbi:protein-disulfide reductase DsbD family protein [Akkermansiaceae bacterium]|nr:protein-disulfide reductase DsbD family protein [Akkermansiaceae bacterium]
MKFIYSTLLVLTISTGLLHAQNDLFSTSDDTAEDSYTQASIISDVEQAMPGDIITIAIQLEHADGWHAYYQNPGGPGLPLEFDWQLPTGYALTQLYWPTPELYQSEGVQFYIYQDRYTMLADISVPSTAKAGDQAKISVTPTWQLCDDKGCAPPTSKELMVTIPIGESQILSTEHESQFHLARSQLPESNQSWNIEAKIKAADLVLTISSSDGSVAILDSIYYIDNAGITDSSKAQAVNDRGDAYILKAPLSASAKPGGTIEGILIFDGQEAVAISSPLSNPAAEALSSKVLGSDSQETNSAAHDIGNKAPTAAEIAAAAELYDAEQKIDFVLLDGSKEKAHSLSTALGFIFIGGLLLNLMPCVFPVLGLKVMGFAQQAGSEPQKIKIHGLVFMAGVVFSMWILAGIIYILIFSFGRDINWGEQLTSPIFLASIIMLLYLFGLNMAGVFELGTSLTGAGGDLQTKKGYSGSFFSGVLTTLIATPCSGPFLGSVMGYTLKQPPLQGMVIFTIFALGISSPYVILAFFPKLINKLPKPGAWMVTFKQLMAFALFATAAYFFQSFAKITGTGGASWLLMAAVVIGLAVWAYGRFGTPYTPKLKKFVWGTSFPLLVATGAFFMTKSATEQRAPETPLTGSSWYPGVVELNRSKGRIVWVDYTADW